MMVDVEEFKNGLIAMQSKQSCVITISGRRFRISDESFFEDLLKAAGYEIRKRQVDLGFELVDE